MQPRLAVGSSGGVEGAQRAREEGVGPPRRSPAGMGLTGAVGPLAPCSWGGPSPPLLVIQQIAFPATPEAREEPLTFIDVRLVLGTHMISNILPRLRGLFNCQSPVCTNSS